MYILFWNDHDGLQTCSLLSWHPDGRVPMSISHVNDMCMTQNQYCSHAGWKTLTYQSINLCQIPAQSVPLHRADNRHPITLESCLSSWGAGPHHWIDLPVLMDVETFTTLSVSIHLSLFRSHGQAWDNSDEMEWWLVLHVIETAQRCQTR